MSSGLKHLRAVPGLSNQARGIEQLPETIGRYKVTSLLGAGECARVYACHDGLLDRPVALKVLHSGLPQIVLNSRLERFRVELRVFGRVSHPHVVGVYDARLEDAQPYLVMELCPGPTLDVWTSRFGRMSPGQVGSLVYQVSLALDHIHSLGIIHRDVKPSNLIFDNKVLKLTDFGVAQADFIAFAGESGVVGTPAYMAPEQFAGEKIHQRADLFSLGAIMYEALVGRPPLHGDPTSVLWEQAYAQIPPVSRLAPDLQPGFDDFFARALSADPAQRFGSGAELCAAYSKIVPEAELEALEGLDRGMASVKPRVDIYGYGQAPRRHRSWLEPGPMREPPPPECPSEKRFHGAVPVPWAPVRTQASSTFEIMEFDGEEAGSEESVPNGASTSMAAKGESPGTIPVVEPGRDPRDSKHLKGVQEDLRWQGHGTPVQGASSWRVHPGGWQRSGVRHTTWVAAGALGMCGAMMLYIAQHLPNVAIGPAAASSQQLLAEVDSALTARVEYSPFEPLTPGTWQNRLELGDTLVSGDPDSAGRSISLPMASGSDLEPSNSSVKLSRGRGLPVARHRAVRSSSAQSQDRSSSDRLTGTPPSSPSPIAR